ncbi:antitoxin VapB family protein [Stygiolobus sp. CP859M]|jgi:predicted CopG family antitoxin|uniref:antitoxin VapB family protein n=1 Tax=Stygiolobus sp. CP859M TaxID=3133135 RepID=UPI00307DE020
MNNKVTTISISEEVKEKLEREKGDLSWDEFLLLLLSEYRKRKAEENLTRLKDILNEDDIKRIEESHKKMHEEFKL